MTAEAEALDAPIQESAKWTKAPFNVADATTTPVMPKRKTGYVLGKWAAHKREDWDKSWHSLTCLPALVLAAPDTSPSAGDVDTPAG